MVSTARDSKGWKDRRRDGCFLLILSCLWASCTSTSRERQRQRDEEEEDEGCELLTALSLQQGLSEQVIIDTHTGWSLITLSMLQYERSQTELVNYSRVWNQGPGGRSEITFAFSFSRLIWSWAADCLLSFFGFWTEKLLFWWLKLTKSTWPTFDYNSADSVWPCWVALKHHANTDQTARAPFHWSECVCAFVLYIYSVCVAYCPSVGAPADTMSVHHDSRTPSPSSWSLTAGFLDPSISLSERGEHESRGSRCEAENKTHLFLPSEANQSPNRWLTWVIRTTKYPGGTEDEELC